MLRFLFVAGCVSAWAGTAEATDVDFVRDVRPIFEKHCYACHGEAKQKSGLRLDIKSEAFKGGVDWGPSLVPGSPQESPLIELITSPDADTRMPPDSEPLSMAEIQSLQQWVEEGANWPQEVDVAKLVNNRDHWSFQAPAYEASLGSLSKEPFGALNAAGSGTNQATDFPQAPATILDRFVDVKLAEQGLTRNRPADPGTLVRRMHLDLLGLPPSPEQVASFVSHPDVRTLVDELLASPRYGERWAQHWLDVIRWAETVGFETNFERSDAWPYRDWVIEALNADKPYDQFVFEQIAGDTVGEDAALGFLVAGPANLPGQIGRDESAMRGARQDELDEVIGTVSQAFMGLTVGCARCHDHKFDPILESDYYSMQAIFAGLQYGSRRLRGAENDDWTDRVPEARERVARLHEKLNSLRRESRLREPLADIHTESFKPIFARAVRVKIEATNNLSPASLYEFEVWSQAVDEGTPAVNVALASQGASITASSFALENQSRHFDNLIDGSVDERQAYPWVAAAAGPAWFEIQFNEPCWIDRFVLRRGWSMPADMVIEVLSERPGYSQAIGVGSEEASGDPAVEVSSAENAGQDTGGGDEVGRDEAGSDSNDEQSIVGWLEVVHTRDRFPRMDDTRGVEALRLDSILDSVTQRIAALLGEIRGAEAGLGRLEAGPQVYAASFIPDPAVTFVLHRGDAMRPLDEVAPAVPEFLGKFAWRPGASESARRVALANWLIQADHPLTARVIVNRVWQHHFGTGLVKTPSDFGRMGVAPSHPELLDWLATRFVADGWSLKKLHRLILTSDTYQQSSVPNAAALAVDAEARLLWRFPPRRLEAEAIRDSVLSVSGNLNLAVGGRGFDFFNQRGGLSDYVAKETFDEDGWRRMIYAHKVRMITVDVFGAFDCPDAGQMKPSRTQSITPVQSLGLLNSPFLNRQAGYFAERLRSEAGNDPVAQVDLAFALAFARGPNVEELQFLSALAREHGLEHVCRAILNTSELSSIQ